MSDSGIRQARVEDHPALVACIQNWWGDSRSPDQAQALSKLLPRLFLEHFATTSLVVEGPGGEIQGFLVGFHSGDHAEESYIHFVGVHPAVRQQGIARRLYERFFDLARAAGRRQVRAITSPPNKGSIAFHRAMGFQIEQGDDEIDGIPVHWGHRPAVAGGDHDGAGHPRVCFRRRL